MKLIMIRYSIFFCLLLVMVELAGCVTGGVKTAGKTSTRSDELKKEYVEKAAENIASHYATREKTIWSGRDRSVFVSEFSNRTDYHIDTKMVSNSLVSSLKKKNFPEPLKVTKGFATLLSGSVSSTTTRTLVLYKIDVTLRDVKSQEILWVGTDTITIRRR